MGRTHTPKIAKLDSCKSDESFSRRILHSMGGGNCILIRPARLKARPVAKVAASASVEVARGSRRQEIPVDQRTASAQRSVDTSSGRAHPHFPFSFFPFSSPCWDSGMQFSVFFSPNLSIFSGRVDGGELPGVAV